VNPQIDPTLEALFLDGRHDIERWAANGLGIRYHDKQLEVLNALSTEEAAYYLLWWANRAGKTTTVIGWHLHGIFYKFELPEPLTDRDYELWKAEDYRTIHTAPLNSLAQRAWNSISEISKGTHPAQRDENGRRREAPLGVFFSPGTERAAAGGEHMIVKCLTGGTMDLFSTEGGGARIEGAAWYRGSWDEWPRQESADKGTAIRNVLTLLSNRLSDFNGKLLLTGTVTEDTEHIAKDWIELCDDPDQPDWWGSSASRMDNPSANKKAIARAERNFDKEDYDRTVLGLIGGVKGRLFPTYMVEPTFTKALPRFTPPHPEDGATFEPGPEIKPLVEPAARRWGGKWRPKGNSPYTHLHLWDLAIAVADNVGQVWRLPSDFRFDVDHPIVGVKRTIVPGSRTLTSAEILHTIEETYLPYGGLIVVDATDAHGKNIHRELRSAGYPVEAFVFNERDKAKGVIRKDQAILHTRDLLTEGMVVSLDSAGEQITDADGVPVFDRDQPYGVLRLPREWVRTRDQLSVLKVDDDRQRKDEAMVVLMGCDTAYRLRRSRTRQVTPQRLAVFAGARRYGRTQ
jgi:hypothetical protein